MRRVPDYEYSREDADKGLKEGTPESRERDRERGGLRDNKDRTKKHLIMCSAGFGFPKGADFISTLI